MYIDIYSYIYIYIYQYPKDAWKRYHPNFQTSPYIIAENDDLFFPIGMQPGVCFEAKTNVLTGEKLVFLVEAHQHHVWPPVIIIRSKHGFVTMEAMTTRTMIAIPRQIYMDINTMYIYIYKHSISSCAHILYVCKHINT